MARIDHTNCSHPRTPAGRRACRAGSPAKIAAPVVVRPSIDTPAGPVAVGSVILAEVRGGSPERYTVLNISDDIKNGYAGWDADGRWGYADQVLRVITF